MNKYANRMIRNMMVLGCFLGSVMLLVSCSAETKFETSAKAYEKTELASETTGDKNEGSNRKIIYEAKLELIVKEFSKVEESMSLLVKEHGGYLSQVSVDRASGEHRSGSWEARIPVEQFDLFKKAISELGVVESQSETAQDVTEQFVDLKARIENKKKLETRIIELLADKKGKISDVIEVERELSRVRGEIEQMEGRLRFLTNRTDMSTIKIRVREERDYVPPKAPSFLSNITHSWEKSFLSLQKFGEQIIIAIVYAMPWFIVVSVIGLPAIWWKRRKKP